MLILYEEEFFQVCEDKSMDIKEGKRIYRKFLREHQDPGTYYVSAFLENESHKTAALKSKMEQLFRLFDIELEALAGVHIEKWEAEMICSIFEEKDWERYKELLLTANLCKYIQQIELLYEDDIPEEIQYRRSCEESAVKNMEYEMKRMEQRISELEKQKKAKESELIETECQVERLKRELMKKEEKYEKESTELRNLRDYLFHPKEDRKEKKEDRPDIGRLGRSVVIGGHRNWQKKMQQCLPGSQFLTYDNMNFDPTVLRNKKYIIVNTDILKHGLYYKVMNERKKEQKILYVHGNNVERTLREISDQLQ